MFDPIKNGTVETIQGLDCWVPPRPKISEIQGSHLPKKKQKWYRTELPQIQARHIDWFSGDEYEPDDLIDWDTARREEIIKQTGCDPWNVNNQGHPKPVPGVVADEDYINPILDDFRSQELERIRHGHWFMNNGTAVYLTGFHYFYLNWWKLNTGYPDFRDSDRKIFYFWQYCLEDDNCYGISEITKRGVGKSYRVGSVAYLMCISHKKVHVGMQSKTDEDAEELFLSKVVEPMKDLPDFLIPINNHGSDPKKKLNFFAPAKRGKGARFSKKSKDSELRSFMTFRNAGEKAYDGTTLKFLILDENGKLDPRIGDAKKRLGVTRNCVYRDSKMVGKIWATTTVEEMEKGGKACMEIHYDSDLSKRSDIGRTKSGLYPFFMSALDCSYFDEYGYPDREKAFKEHEAERKIREGDSVEWTGYVQRNPYNINEAFMVSGTKCIYNAKVLQERQVALSNPDFNGVERGDFVWENGIPDTKAIWVPNDVNGKWFVSWRFKNEKEEANRVKVEEDYNGFKTFTPLNVSFGGFAFDPYSHTETVDKRRSNGASAVFRNYNPFYDPNHSNTWIADYVARPDDPDECSEDQIIACHYFGIKILIENNKNDSLRYFKKRGYGNFILKRPKDTFTKDDASQSTDGIPSVTPVIDYYIKRTKSHIHNYGHLLKHLRIVKDLLEFDPSNRTKFDLGVASQLALIAAEAPVEEIIDEFETSDLFGVWDHSGEYGQMIN